MVVSTSSALRAMARGTPARRAVSRMRATKKRSLTTARTGPPFWGAISGPLVWGVWGAISGPLMSSIALLTDAEPVLLPLGNVGESGEIAHPIEVHVTVEVIGLVLGDACEEVLRVDDLPGALAVEIFEPDRRVAWHHAPHVGHRDAAFPPVLHLVGQRGDDGIDDDRERNFRSFGIARVGLNLDDRDLPGNVDLVGGESRSVVLAHRLDHVVDELLRRGGPNLFWRERLRLLTQDGMPEPRDLQNRHDLGNCSMQVEGAIGARLFCLDAANPANPRGEPPCIGVEEALELLPLLEHDGRLQFVHGALEIRIVDDVPHGVSQPG